MSTKFCPELPPHVHAPDGTCCDVDGGYIIEPGHPQEGVPWQDCQGADPSWMPAPERTTRLDPADFASLLEREPEQVSSLECLEERARALHRSLDYERKLLDDAIARVGVVESEHDKYKALYLAEQQMRRDDAARVTTLEKGISSAAARIKELEGVLVAVRAKAFMLKLPEPPTSARRMATEIIEMANETLDPCKPWCVLEPGHGGACCPQEDERE